MKISTVAEMRNLDKSAMENFGIAQTEISGWGM